MKGEQSKARKRYDEAMKAIDQLRRETNAQLVQHQVKLPNGATYTLCATDSRAR